MKIDKGIPIPKKVGKVSEFAKVANEMKTGDSVGGLSHYASLKLRQALSSKSFRVTCRREPGDAKTYRVWKGEPL